MVNREEMQFHMQNCTFQRNKAMISSALYFYSFKEDANSNVTVVNSTFDSNVAARREVKYSCIFFCYIVVAIAI
jgi:hypothetical protein